MKLEEHYGMLLGLTAPWRVVKVEVAFRAQRIDISVEYQGKDWRFPVCREAASGYDHLME